MEGPGETPKKVKQRRYSLQTQREWRSFRHCLYNFADDGGKGAVGGIHQKHDRGSAPSSPAVSRSIHSTPSKFKFFAKLSKKSKSGTKAEKKTSKAEDGESENNNGALEPSRSQESLSLGASDVLHSTDSTKARVGTHQGDFTYTSPPLRNRLRAFNAELRRTENTLKIWIMEVKGVPSKKRYYCNLVLGNEPCRRTFSKTMSRMCFWGEYFEFESIPKLLSIRIDLLREGDKGPGSKKIGTVDIELPLARCPNKLVDEWYTVSVDKQERVIPTLRVKHRFQSLDILPLPLYNTLRLYLRDNATTLCKLLEPLVCVKGKEDISTSLINIMQAENKAIPFLVSLILSDVQRIVENDHLLLRGNSIATKAIEAYMRLVGEYYLQETLSEPVQSLISATEDLEVDPLRITRVTSLPTNRDALKKWATKFWDKIVHSGVIFPIELRKIFHFLRKHLSTQEKSEVTDNLTSACVFLRFLCPAILYPSLFNITQEYPEEGTVRNLTLVAKTLQTLANFTSFRGKENYMEFLNEFIDKEKEHCKSFLKTISSLPCEEEKELQFAGPIDLGRHCALLHLHLADVVSQPNAKTNWNEINEVVALVEGINIVAVKVRQRKQPIPCQVTSSASITTSQLSNQSYLQTLPYLSNNYKDDRCSTFLENSLECDCVGVGSEVSIQTSTKKSLRSHSYPHSDVPIYEHHKELGTKSFNCLSSERRVAAPHDHSTKDDYFLVAAFNHQNELLGFPNSLMGHVFPLRSHSVPGIPSPLQGSVLHQGGTLDSNTPSDSCSQEIATLVLDSENIQGFETSISPISNMESSSGYHTYPYFQSPSPVDSHLQSDSGHHHVVSSREDNCALTPPEVQRHIVHPPPVASQLHQASSTSKKPPLKAKHPSQWRNRPTGHASLHDTTRRIGRLTQTKETLDRSEWSSQSVEDFPSLGCGGGSSNTARQGKCSSSSSSDSSPDSRPALCRKTHLHFATNAALPRTNPLCSPYAVHSPAFRRELQARSHNQRSLRYGRRNIRSGNQETVNHHEDFGSVAGSARASPLIPWEMEDQQLGHTSQQALSLVPSHQSLSQQEAKMRAIVEKLTALEQEFHHAQNRMWQEMQRRDARLDDQAQKIAELDHSNAQLTRTVAKFNNLGIQI